MRSVERRFAEFTKVYPDHSSFIVYSRTIQRQGFTQRVISVHFNKLVQKCDYLSQDKNRLLKHMYSLSKKLEERQKGGQKSPITHEMLLV